MVSESSLYRESQVACEFLRGTRACRYEPEIQRSYEELARHYGTVILPARPAHPRDKAKVEVE